MRRETVFTEEHELFRTHARRFLEKEAVPFHAQWEENGVVPRESWEKAGENGFLCPMVPEAYGGAGADFRYNVVFSEELARLGLTGPNMTMHSDIIVPYLCRLGNEEQKERFLPGCLAGTIVTALAMTEPGAGSDLQAIQTTAVRDGDHYVLNGSKIFISNGQLCGIVIVACKTSPEGGKNGISLLIVEEGMPGFSNGKNLKRVGRKAQDTSELYFDNVRVPVKNRLGEEGKGFGYMMQELSQERLITALAGLACSESIFEQAVEYVQQRKLFGSALATFQNTQFKLAELDTELTAARAFADLCLKNYLDGGLDVVTAAKIKLLATELECRVIDECLQLHGGYGYMWECPVARAYADSRVERTYAGSSEVMKLIIGRKLLGK